MISDKGCQDDSSQSRPEHNLVAFFLGSDRRFFSQRLVELLGQAVNDNGQDNQRYPIDKAGTDVGMLQG